MESILARIRIGHSHLILLPFKKKDLSQCIACDCRFTMKHSLFDCVYFIETRNWHFNVNSFKELFEKIPPDRI